MSNPSLHPLELILRRCAEKAPDPWYPRDYAKETGNARDSLDPYLDQLRLGGLTRLTDWVAGHGQGYALTPAGQEILKNPRQFARLLAGKWSPVAARENRPTATASSPWERGEAVRQALLYPVLAMAIQPFPCVGASGAICGIFAGEAAWVFYNRGHLDPRVFSAWNRNFLINVVLIAFISFFPGVSWGAHLGGAIAGLLIALWLN